MDIKSWRFPSPSVCEYRPLEESFRQTKQRTEPNSIMDLKRDILWIQQAKNQEKRPSEVEDITIFPKPVIRSQLWKAWEINSTNNPQTEIRQEGPVLQDPRIPEDIPEEFWWNSMQRNRRIFMVNNFPFSAIFSLEGVNEFSLQLIDDQRPYSFILRLRSILRSLEDHGHIQKLSRYKAHSSFNVERLKSSLTARYLQGAKLVIFILYFRIFLSFL